jgi:hypothetical protein
LGGQVFRCGIRTILKLGEPGGIAAG